MSCFDKLTVEQKNKKTIFLLCGSKFLMLIFVKVFIMLERDHLAKLIKMIVKMHNYIYFYSFLQK